MSRPPKSDNDKPEDETDGFASPACSMHEVDPAYFGYLSAAEVEALEKGLSSLSRAEAAARLRKALPRIADDTLHARLKQRLSELED